MANTQRIM